MYILKIWRRTDDTKLDAHDSALFVMEAIVGGDPPLWTPPFSPEAGAYELQVGHHRTTLKFDALTRTALRGNVLGAGEKVNT